MNPWWRVRTGASSDARNYGVTLAAMSRYAHNITMMNSSALVKAYMRDAPDGVMDGREGVTPITMPMGGTGAQARWHPPHAPAAWRPR